MQIFPPSSRSLALGLLFAGALGSSAGAATIGTTDASQTLFSAFNGGDTRSLQTDRVFGQTFVVPSAVTGGTTLGSFSFVVNDTTRPSSTVTNVAARIRAELQGRLYEIDANDRLTLLSDGSAASVRSTDQPAFEDVLFNPLDANGDQIELDLGGRYALIAIEQNSRARSDNETLFEVGTTPDGDAYADGEAYSLDLPLGSVDGFLNGSDEFLTNPGVRSGDYDLAFSVVLVPEPASLALASVGGLLLLRRRA